MKKGQTVILKDGSEWIITKIVDWGKSKDRLIKSFRKDSGRLDYHLKGEYSEIIMSEKRLLNNIATSN